MKNVRIKFKYKMRDIIEEYTWIVGLSLIISSIVLIFSDPISLLIVGIICAGVGVWLKGSAKK